MNDHHNHRKAWGTFLAILLAVTVVGALTTLLFSAQTISQANDTIDRLSTQLARTNSQLEQVRDDQATAETRSVQAKADRDQLQKQLDALTNYLKRNGIQLPDSANAAPSVTRGSSEVAPATPRRAAPRATSTPAPKSSPQPTPAPKPTTPTPAPEPTCTVGLLGLCVLS